ncbi:MAG: NAD(P)-dependent oxidoreductase, partial [Sandaracinobacteroides sp.]
SYSPAEIARAIATATGTRAGAIQIPPVAIHIAASAAAALGRLSGRLPSLTRDRAGYMAHPDWSADSSAIRALGIWQPQTPLIEGMAATAIWYRAQGMLQPAR